MLSGDTVKAGAVADPLPVNCTTCWVPAGSASSAIVSVPASVPAAAGVNATCNVQPVPGSKIEGQLPVSENQAVAAIAAIVSGPDP